MKRTGSGDALITVMKSADLRRRDDSPGGWRLHFTCMGAIAVECLMRARRIQQKTSKSPVQNDFPRDQRVTGHGRLVLITHI
jgi:hypothetical protein